MTVRIAINGLGRIGRCILRLLSISDLNLDLVAVNGTLPIEKHVHLVKYDSVFGRFSKISKKDDKTMLIGDKEVIFLQERDPRKLPWQELDIDLVLECTGAFKDRTTLAYHLSAGAKKVILSAPPKDKEVKTVVYGVNDNECQDHDIISVGLFAPLIVYYQ